MAAIEVLHIMYMYHIFKVLYGLTIFCNFQHTSND
jgi:hypothetical protein